MIAIIAFTRRGCWLACRLAAELEAAVYAPERLAEEVGAASYGTLRDWTAEQFRRKNDMIFVSATGIAVRSIAPHVRDKLTDPAVVAVDELGRFAVPLLSGHVGGANALALQVAGLTGGQAVISTATDLHQVFAVDVWAKENDLVLVERERIREISGALLEGRQVGFRSCWTPEGRLPAGLVETEADLGIAVCNRVEDAPFVRTLHLLPRNLVLGVGCKRGTTREQLQAVLHAVLEENGLDPRRICRVGTIDLKQDENGLLALCEGEGWPIEFFTAEALRAAEGSFPASAFVQSVTGVDNVCQRAVVCMGAEVLLPKQSGQGVTVSVGSLPVRLGFGDGDSQE